MELEPPPVETVAICGALLKAHLAVNATTERLTKEFVGRNAAPPPDLLTSLVELKVDFIWNQTSFAFDIYRHSPDNFTVSSNGSLAQAKLQAMPGGSYVCTFGGVKHNFHFESEPGERTRVTLDGKVVVLSGAVRRQAHTRRRRRPRLEGRRCEVEVMKVRRRRGQSSRRATRGIALVQRLSRCIEWRAPPPTSSSPTRKRASTTCSRGSSTTRSPVS